MYTPTASRFFKQKAGARGQRYCPAAPKKLKPEADFDPWICAARVANDSGFAVEVFSTNGALFGKGKSFALSVTRDDRHFSIRVRRNELEWLTVVLEKFRFGTHTLAVYKDRSLEAVVMDEVVRLWLRTSVNEDKDFKLYFAATTLDSVIGVMKRVLKVSEEAPNKEDLFQAALLIQACHPLWKTEFGTVPRNGCELLCRAYGSDAPSEGELVKWTAEAERLEKKISDGSPCPVKLSGLFPVVKELMDVLKDAGLVDLTQ